MANKTPREDIIKEIQWLEKNLRRPPKLTEMVEWGDYSPDVYYNEFDSWPDALRSSGIEPVHDETEHYNASREDLLDELVNLHQILGKSPTVVEMDKLGKYYYGCYAVEFGSWNDALIEAGLDPRSTGRGQQKIHTSESIIKEIKEFNQEMGYTPNITEFLEYSDAQQLQIRREFHSWYHAVSVAGLSTDQLRSPGRDHLLEILQEFSVRIDRVPTEQDMDEYGPYDSELYKRTFSEYGWDWDDIIHLTGIHEVMGKDE